MVLGGGGAQMAPRRRRYLYVCTTLITTVMFVYFSRGRVRFWQRRGIIASLLHEKQLVQYDERGEGENTRTHTHTHAHTDVIPKPGGVDDGNGLLFHPRPV